MVMADDLPSNELTSREPTVEDLRDLCRELNQRGAKYVVVGGFAIRAANYTLGHHPTNITNRNAVAAVPFPRTQATTPLALFPFLSGSKVAPTIRGKLGLEDRIPLGFAGRMPSQPVRHSLSVAFLGRSSPQSGTGRPPLRNRRHRFQITSR
jgi:hypothetical protein